MKDLPWRSVQIREVSVLTKCTTWRSVHLIEVYVLTKCSCLRSVHLEEVFVKIELSELLRYVHVVRLGYTALGERTISTPSTRSATT